MKSVKIAIAQINTVVGDLAGNTDRILSGLKEASNKAADLVIFPELAITGYPPEDLLFKPHFVKENISYLKKITAEVRDIIAIIGFVDKDMSGIYNSAAIIYNKKICCIYRKIHLPNYGVFDEKRYFKPGSENVLIEAGDFSFAVNICEDIWVKESRIEKQVLSKADFLVNISASPYHFGKMKEREKVIKDKAKRFAIPVVYCNLVGGQDELIFDGRSALFWKDGALILEAKAFKEDLFLFDLPLSGKMVKARIQAMTKDEEIYSALMLGVRDYVRKNNFNKVIFGLSGGIDSALVACIAVDAIGKENVHAIIMPSRYSSDQTQSDAETIAKNLGIDFSKIPIDGIFDSYLDTLSLHFKDRTPNIAEENIQARIRGNILMAFSNKFGCLVLNTGNKSETSAGYCTLYGDMAGGFSVIKDVPKRLVYELTRYRNKKDGRKVIPESVFDRPPSAELRPGQKDQDTLPPYGILDKIIDLYIEKDKGFDDIVRTLGHSDTVRKVLNMIDKSEYKRRQAAPGIKITPRSFGKDRRMPITNKFMEARYGKYNK